MPLARVLARDQAVRSCVLLLSSLNENSKVVTLEGLGTPDNLHPVGKHAQRVLWSR